MNLYEIDKALQELYDNIEVDEETGEVILDEEKLKALELEQTTKIEGTALYIRNIKAEKDAIRKEKQRLTKKLEALENKEDRLKAYLHFGCKGEKFKTPLVTVSFRELEKVVIDDETFDKTDEKYQKQHITTKVDETKVLEDLKNGIAIKGATYTIKPSVTIR